MKRQKKLRAFPRAHAYRQVGNAYAYFHEGDLAFYAAEQDNTFVSLSQDLPFPDIGVSFGEYQRNIRLHEVHREKVNNVGMATLVGAIGGGPKAATLSFGAAVYTQCWNSCHCQSPPKEP